MRKARGKSSVREDHELFVPAPRATVARRLQRKAARRLAPFSAAEFLGEVDGDAFRLRRMAGIPFQFLALARLQGRFEDVEGGTRVKCSIAPDKLQGIAVGLGVVFIMTPQVLLGASPLLLTIGVLGGLLVSLPGALTHEGTIRALQNALAKE